jgi:hypothetical protein
MDFETHLPRRFCVESVEDMGQRMFNSRPARRTANPLLRLSTLLTRVGKVQLAVLYASVCLKYFLAGGLKKTGLKNLISQWQNVFPN